MNANELADWIQVTDFYENTDDHFINDTMDEVEAMLRQQQAEIEALKERLEDTNSGWLNATKTACTAQAEIEELKRKYKDMHNLATQAMSRVHELEKAQQ